jgi:hypothetical protein
MEVQKIANEECNELKNIKYKTMLLNGNPLQETKSANNLSNLDKFLEDEKLNNKNEPWCKLNKTIKTKKLIDFAETYKTTNNLDDVEEDLLVSFFKDSLDRNKLQKVKDVIYDKVNGIIKDVPALHYIKTTKHFTLKNIDKRVSTLKSLAPKKTNSTIKNKHVPKQTTTEMIGPNHNSPHNKDCCRRGRRSLHPSKQPNSGVKML